MEETTTAASVEQVPILAIDSLFTIPLILAGVANLVCLLFFGVAVHQGWTDDLAPRVSNRPKAVVPNAMFYHFPEDWKRLPNRAWLYPVAWIVWAYRLTYDEMLKGIPGTGTRRDGSKGPLLKTNLDAVILLRFHALLFKVGVLVAVLCLVILPVNLTAGCDVNIFGEGTCTQRDTNAVGFIKTTFANIPDKIFNDNILDVQNANFTTSDLIFFTNFTEFFRADSESLAFTFWVPGHTWRVWVTLVSCVLVYLYALHLLAQEWIENIALRRKHYLEATHYSQRMQELNLLSFQQKSRRNDEKLVDSIVDSNIGDDEAYSARVRASRERQENDPDARPEHFVHPEIRDTPPSIGIFSALYQLPASMVTYDTDGATTLERQLVATTNFFSEIVPPAPGFSSAVAAVTVLPDARLVHKTKAKWEACEKKLQKLRYIRRRIRRCEEQDNDGHEEMDNDEHNRSLEEPERETQQQAGKSDNKFNDKGHSGNAPRMIGSRIGHDGSVESVSSGEKSTTRGDHEREIAGFTEEDAPDVITTSHSEQPPSPLRPSASVESNGVQWTPSHESTAAVFRYEDFDVCDFATSIGFHEEVHDVAEFVDGMGIEEFNVFARKCAELAAGPGFDKKLLRLYTVEKLREEERTLLEELREANAELLEARKDVVNFASDNEFDESKMQPNHPSIPCEDEESVVQRYGDCESAGRFALGMRRRRTDGKNTVNLEEGNHASPMAIGESDSPEPAKKPIPFKGMLGELAECLVSVPKRIYRGRSRIRESEKYYGLPKREEETGKAFVTNLEHPSYAVVTFTTRQAAVIARQCLADGAAENTWKQVDDIPVYPLADAPPYSVTRPVTPTIRYGSKKVRLWLVYIVLTLFTITNVFFVRRINSWILNPDTLNRIFRIPKERATKITSLASGYTQILLFAICPTIFSLLANSEGSATSMEMAEKKAVLYFWYFYIVARFLGQIVWDSFIEFFQGSATAEAVINQGITDFARRVPTTLGPTALSFILSSLSSFPLVYFLPIQMFATSFLRLAWINRVLKGGGLGAEIPYRIYVDFGYVFAVMTALAPLCPLIGPFALLYFIIIAPMLRWLVVFGYRPKFDGGGDKWPRLHHIIVSSLILGQVITSISFFLKRTPIEGALVLMLVIPTLLGSHIILEKFLRPYQDTALLQTRRMYSHATDTTDGTDGTTACLEREEYRRWLVDCHKASYLPTCLSGGTENLLTTEPAMVISDQRIPDGKKDERWKEEHEVSLRNLMRLQQRQQAQKGGILRGHRFGLY